MTPSLSIRFLIMTCAAVCSLSGVRGRKIELNWTSEGIKEYTRYVQLSLLVCAVETWYLLARGPTSIASVLAHAPLDIILRACVDYDCIIIPTNWLLYVP